jgi:hypothetical protein
MGNLRIPPLLRALDLTAVIVRLLPLPFLVRCWSEETLGDFLDTLEKKSKTSRHKFHIPAFGKASKDPSTLLDTLGIGSISELACVKL